jgi:uncharacterized protein (DUF2132 family)
LKPKFLAIFILWCPPVGEQQPNNPMHGVTLQEIITTLVEWYGWEKLGLWIPIKCFNNNPSVKSSLKFLRKTPWARSKVDHLYLVTLKKKQKLQK